MRTVVSCLLLAALISSACASGGTSTAADPPAPAPAPAVAPESDQPAMPRSVGDFVEQNRERCPNPALGIRVRYAKPDGLGADAYLYPNALTARDTAVEAIVVAAGEEADEAADAIRIFEQRGAYTDVMFKQPTELMVSGSSGRVLRGVHIAATLRQGGQFQRSDIFVFVLGPHFLKIRATYPPGNDASTTSGEIRKLATELAAALDAQASTARTP